MDMMRSVLRLVIVALFAGMLTIIPRTSALAGSYVDPSTLNPPPQLLSPPGTVISCQTDGSNIICRGAYAFSGTFDHGAECSQVNPSYTFDVAETYSITLNFTWLYNTAGNITNSQLRVQYSDVVTNTVNGVTARGIGGGTDDLFFGTPGDPTTITEKVTGVFGRYSIQGSGNVIHDVGTFTVSPTGMITFHGQFDSVQLGQDPFTALCNGLAA
jgi:hypothetical protein